MPLIKKTSGQLLKVGGLLATSTSCCCDTCISVPSCECLPSSLSVAIPAWTHRYGFSGPFLVCPAQTVIAYKCCFTYTYAGHTVFYVAYRTTMINIGTVNYNGCQEPVYFYLSFLHGTTPNAGDIPNYCSVEVGAAILQRRITTPCVFCATTPLVISPLTACYKITEFNQCTYTNTFMDYRYNSVWTSFTNCSCISTGITNQIVGSTTLETTSSNCSPITSAVITFANFTGPPTTFTITVT